MTFGELHHGDVISALELFVNPVVVFLGSKKITFSTNQANVEALDVVQVIEWRFVGSILLLVFNYGVVLVLSILPCKDQLSEMIELLEGTTSWVELAEVSEGIFVNHCRFGVTQVLSDMVRNAFSQERVGKEAAYWI